MPKSVRGAARCHPFARAGVRAACGLALALQCANPATAEGGAGSYDGSWKGHAITEIGGGRCGLDWKLDATVSGGEISGTAVRAAERYPLNGSFKSDGKVRWEAFGPGANAWGKGKVEGDTASGSWFDNQKSDCEGSFELRRGG